MSRLAAFALLTLAAFDAPVPWLDRLGVAALGLALLALAVGRGSAVARPTLFRPRAPALLDELGDFETVTRDLASRMEPYGKP